MVRFRPPSTAAVAAFLGRQSRQPFSYREVGRTNGDPPPGYDFDHRRALLGHGLAAFDAARVALVRWAMFDLGWARVCGPKPPIEPGAMVAVAAQAAGLWWLNACRIVYVVDEPEPPRRFGFAYGTLPGHVERGEERFLVELLDDGSVWYDLSAFSRPQHWLARLTYPLARRWQRRFAEGSLAAMQRAVKEGQGVA